MNSTKVLREPISNADLVLRTADDNGSISVEVTVQLDELDGEPPEVFFADKIGCKKLLDIDYLVVGHRQHELYVKVTGRIDVFEEAEPDSWSDWTARDCQQFLEGKCGVDVKNIRIADDDDEGWCNVLAEWLKSLKNSRNRQNTKEIG